MDSDFAFFTWYYLSLVGPATVVTVVLFMHLNRLRKSEGGGIGLVLGTCLIAFIVTQALWLHAQDHAKKWFPAKYVDTGRYEVLKTGYGEGSYLQFWLDDRTWSFNYSNTLEPGVQTNNIRTVNITEGTTPTVEVYEPIERPRLYSLLFPLAGADPRQYDLHYNPKKTTVYFVTKGTRDPAAKAWVLNEQRLADE